MPLKLLSGVSLLRLGLFASLLTGYPMASLAQTTFYVSLQGSNTPPYNSWATAATSIQTAIDVASAGDTILVTNGVYQTGSRTAGSQLLNRVVISNAVTVQSVNGPEFTVIRGSGPVGNSAVRCVWMTNGAVLVGFTLTNGATRANSALNTNDTYGGGIWASSSNATVINCRIVGNTASVLGGGVYRGTLHGCTIAGNTAATLGGGVFRAALHDGTLVGNTASDGGGAFDSVLYGSRVEGNNASTDGGGLYLGTAYNSVLVNNSAVGSGGGAYSVNLNNGIVVGNLATTGGGAMYGELRNCTVVGNTASDTAGGVYEGTVLNSIVYYNDAVSDPNMTPFAVSHTCTTPLPAGVGNISSAPLFVDLAATNLALTGASPCRDAGDNAAVSGATDISGYPRIMNEVVDIGAHEVLAHLVAVTGTNPVAPYVTWDTAATNIQDAIDLSMDGAVILVSNGIYQTGGRTAPGSLLTNRVVIDKPVSVRSVNGPSATTIRGAFHPATNNGDAAVRCVWMTNGSMLAGFTLTDGATRTNGVDGTERAGGGVHAQSTNAILTNCVISGNAAFASAGGAFSGTLIGCELSDNVAIFGGGMHGSTLLDCLVRGNYARGFGGATFGGVVYRTRILDNAANQQGGGAYLSTLVNCLLAGNVAPQFGGGALAAQLYNCTVVGNTSAVGGGLADGAVFNSIVYHNHAPAHSNYYFSGGGFFQQSCTAPLAPGIGNLANDPTFVDLDVTNVMLAYSSPCRDAGDNTLAVSDPDLLGKTRIVNDIVDMGALEFQIRFVSLSSANPQPPYQSWTNAATNIQHAIDVASPGDLVLVAAGSYATGGRTAPGLALTNRVIIDKPVTVQSVSGPDVTQIVGGESAPGPGARCVWMTNGATLSGFHLLEGNTLISGGNVENYRGGGVYATSLDATVTNCRVEGCIGVDGGGVFRATVQDSLITDNFAVRGGGANSAFLNRCTLEGNIVDSEGGGAYLGELNQCVLVNNLALFLSGGGAYAAELNNCTLVRNQVLDGFASGAGAYGCTVNNSIAYFNDASTAPNLDQCIASYSLSSPLPPGVGNITGNPMFVNIGTSDVRLQAGSPARDMGNNALVSDATDRDGNARIANTFVDMGAYEFQGGPAADYDGDGMSTPDERIGGSDPMDAGDVWGLIPSGALSAGSVAFHSVSGSLYAVDRNEDLLAVPQVWTEFTNGIPGTGAPLVVNDPLPGTNRAYRVRAALAP